MSLLRMLLKMTDLKVKMAKLFVFSAYFLPRKVCLPTFP